MSDLHYICVEEAIETAHDKCKNGVISTQFFKRFSSVLRDLTHADVDPVVRGTWEEHPIADTTDEGEQYVAMFWQCSNCHGKLIYWNFQRTKYCPDCGAHMERSGSGE